jgi:hypothetical protein
MKIAGVAFLGMERAAWTDARLDDRFNHVDGGLSQLRSEMREGFAEVRTEINDLRLVIIRGNWAMIAGLVGVIAAILARGV